MFQLLNHRPGHYLILLLLAGGLSLPNLGGPSLWDIDEGNNAEAAREMLESENWIVPTFNYQLRVDKPALLYWLQILSFRAFGVNEFAARFPSALAALATVLVTYELARRMFGRNTGFIAGLVFSTCGAFVASAHFANPDALLNCLTGLTFLVFWKGFASEGRWWLLAASITTALAVLAKGPIGLVLPFAVVFLFLLWSGELKLIWDRRLLFGSLLFLLVAAPWYVWVAVDTKANFIKGFILQHNVGRYLQPMEHHGGPFYYYLIVLAVGFAPWSIFLIPSLAFAIGKRAREDQETLRQTESSGPAVINTDSNFCYRFLWCWIAVYFLFFTLASTKLPNYILPIYAPVAVMTGRCLERWRTKSIPLPVWGLNMGIAGLMLGGIALAFGTLIAGGVISHPWMRGQPYVGLEYIAFLGLLLMAGAAVAGWCLVRRHRNGLIAVVTTTAALFLGPLFAWGGTALDAFKAPRPLVLGAAADQSTREIRVGSYHYFQPSLVFYCRREVQRIETEEKALEFLSAPIEVYLFLPESEWKQLEAKAPQAVRRVASHRDLYRRIEVVVVTNR